MNCFLDRTSVERELETPDDDTLADVQIDFTHSYILPMLGQEQQPVEQGKSFNKRTTKDSLREIKREAVEGDQRRNTNRKSFSLKDITRPASGSLNSEHFLQNNQPNRQVILTRLGSNSEVNYR